ncbi:12190_t:CDS:1, partial [Ambispora gerdemannii]
ICLFVLSNALPIGDPVGGPADDYRGRGYGDDYCNRICENPRFGGASYSDSIRVIC